jgi:hypothetical protein
MRKATSAIIALLLAVSGVIFISLALPANADEPCFETIEHPAVTHIVHHPAVTHEETEVVTPEIWANWAPNDTRGPQDYTPIWPTDDRGKWIVHDQGVPPGHAGPDGVYQKGGGNSPFFYRQAEVTRTVIVTDSEAYDETVIDKEAWIEQKQVPCDEEPTLDCGDAEYVPVGDECEEEEPPTKTDDPNTVIAPVEETRRSTPSSNPNANVPTAVAAGLAAPAPGTELNAVLLFLGGFMLIASGLIVAVRKN